MVLGYTMLLTDISHPFPLLLVLPPQDDFLSTLLPLYIFDLVYLDKMQEPQARGTMVFVFLRLTSWN